MFANQRNNIHSRRNEQNEQGRTARELVVSLKMNLNSVVEEFLNRGYLIFFKLVSLSKLHLMIIIMKLLLNILYI